MGGSPVVLVVEDEWLLRDCICAHLRGAGLRVFEARTGEAVLSFLAAGERIDVLFTDIQLAGAMSGWEVAAKFRQLRPELPVIYASGRTFEPEQAVPDGHRVAKPYAPDAIIDACRALLRNRPPPC